MTCSARFSDRFETSAMLARRARLVLAGEVTHDSWQLDPHPVYLSVARGPVKWDAAGNPLLDYWMGHGALLAGHAFAPVVEAVRDTVERALHLGGASELQLVWAEEISRLVPSAERVRFVASGTEGTLLALRVARAFTGKTTIVKLDGHFHGWHDEALQPYPDDVDAGFNPGSSKYVLLADPFSVENVLELLSEEDIAAVILEPGGGASGGLPWSSQFLQGLRQATHAHGALLIFDEVISGFRYSPAGVQGITGIIPDLTVLAKILVGGLPGAAVVGRADVMDVFGRGIVRSGRRARVPHTGTFNGNSLSAAAGAAMLKAIADGEHQARAQRAADELVRGVNALAQDRGVDVRLFASSSIFHIMIGAIKAGIEPEPSGAVITLHRARPDLYDTLRRHLLLEGLDSHPVHGWVSSAHDAETIQASVAAFGRAFDALRNVDSFRVSS